MVQDPQRSEGPEAGPGHGYRRAVFGQSSSCGREKLL